MNTASKPLAVSINHDRASINDEPIAIAGPASHFYSIFGTPDRIVDAATTPAPVGHRNNQAHCYDAIGVALNEHHYTHQIHEITFVLDPELSHRRTLGSFAGELTIGDLTLKNSVPESDLAKTRLAFDSSLPGTWFLKVAGDHPITVAVLTKGKRPSSGQRSTTRLVASVSLCLAHDPFDTTFIPADT